MALQVSPSPAEVAPLSDWFTIEAVETYRPFLVSLVSHADHWLFAASNGGLTAGRGSAELSLFPYYTQDKLIDLATTTGPLTRVAWEKDGERRLWAPFAGSVEGARRSIAKRLDGTQLRFTERLDEAGLTFSYSWGFSQRFGFVRKVSLHNTAEVARAVEIVDGLQNLQPCGVGSSFQNTYSNLVDAYKRAEVVNGSALRLVYLSSIPTDRAEPAECLRATVAWSCGLEDTTPLLTTRQLDRFARGEPLTAESEARGERAACLEQVAWVLEPGEERIWYFVADVGQSTAGVSRLQKFLTSTSGEAQRALLEAELATTQRELRRKVGSADGLQLTADGRRQSRHLSNVMFNIMRGGVFLEHGSIERERLGAHLRHFNAPLAARWQSWLEGLPPSMRREELVARVDETGDADLVRLVNEYLPLTFSRRHGDPSRPWNRFNIQVQDEQGGPCFAYQGNWRDIFQNWEALLHSFPEYAEATVFRFLNASTADGYNPYRLTQDGFDWERIEPDEPWSNIGYWGDHQLIYLLRLLETAKRYHPARLPALLERRIFAYAHVPYRIRGYEEILADPRATVDYDEAAERAIAQRVEQIGADGALLAAPGGGILQVSLLEKLLVPLLAKLANFVPDGGIWMNTQRPEWNDANNALVGNGISVVTMAYAHRYLCFLAELLEARPTQGGDRLSVEVADWLEAQAEVFAGDPEEARTALSRRAVMDALGQSAARFRAGLYADGLSGAQRERPVAALLAFVHRAKEWLAASLRGSRRADGLFHSYNLLRFRPDGGVEIEPLAEMLEGQVALLSARLLAAEEALEVTRALRQSALYRADQQSYLLYPDRDMPRFLEKNRVDAAFTAQSPLLQALRDDAEQRIVEVDGDGVLRFGGDLRNRADLEAALAALPARWSELVAAEGEALLGHFEEVFNHRAFTGRSGTFFAYEGLGSIYWHMVSKLVLAIQENVFAGLGTPAAAGLAAAYEEALEGLGMHKSARDYGAFPTDAYSHTPRHAGAQQPGMTGQVKEDILVRGGELGVVVREGCLEFHPRLLSSREFLREAGVFRYEDVGGADQVLEVPPGAIAFTVCQVPVLYRLGETPTLTLVREGARTRRDGTALTGEESRALFHRTGRIAALELEIPRAWTREVFFGPGVCMDMQKP